MLLKLENGAARARISPTGGELKAWSIAGRDLLWEGDSRWWDQSSPILFPIVGWANQGRIKVDGRPRPIGVHGFAARSEFRVLQRDDASIAMEFASDEQTLQIYPFAFRLLVTYRLEPTRLATIFAVENADARTMPYALGLHPAFRWPLGKGSRPDHAIIFEATENPEVPVITAGGLLSKEKRRIPLNGRRLDLTDDLFAADALCFIDANSRAFSFSGGPEGPEVRLETSNFSHLAVWSQPKAPFVSLEAWTGHGDPEGFDGELTDKPSMRLLAPGGTAHHRVDFIYRDAGRSRA